MKNPRKLSSPSRMTEAGLREYLGERISIIKKGRITGILERGDSGFLLKSFNNGAYPIEDGQVIEIDYKTPSIYRNGSPRIFTRSYELDLDGRGSA